MRVGLEFETKQLKTKQQKETNFGIPHVNGYYGIQGIILNPTTQEVDRMCVATFHASTKDALKWKDKAKAEGVFDCFLLQAVNGVQDVFNRHGDLIASQQQVEPSKLKSDSGGCYPSEAAMQTADGLMRSSLRAPASLVLLHEQIHHQDVRAADFINMHEVFRRFLAQAEVSEVARVVLHAYYTRGVRVLRFLTDVQAMSNKRQDEFLDLYPQLKASEVIPGKSLFSLSSIIASYTWDHKYLSVVTLLQKCLVAAGYEQEMIRQWALSDINSNEGKDCRTAWYTLLDLTANFALKKNPTLSIEGSVDMTALINYCTNTELKDTPLKSKRFLDAVSYKTPL